MYLSRVSRVGVAGVSGSFQSLFHIKLRRNFPSNAVAHNEARIRHVAHQNLFLWRHVVRNVKPQNQESMTETNRIGLRNTKIKMLGFYRSFAGTKTGEDLI